MATTKKRIYISVSSAMEESIKALSERDQVPQATKAAELIKIALEVEEDQILDHIASARDTKNSTFVSHEEAWG